jgi:type III secretory pathway component EscU
MRSYSLFDLRFAFSTLQFVVKMLVRAFNGTVFFLTALVFLCTIMASCTQNGFIVGQVCTPQIAAVSILVQVIFL